MKVLKFGGTSVGSPIRMKEVAKLIADQEQKIVVLSAVSGTTNKLVAIANAILEEQDELAQEKIQSLKEEYFQFIDQLYQDNASKTKALDKVEGIERFRISSIEPNLCSNEIIAFVANSERFCPHFQEVIHLDEGISLAFQEVL